MSYAPPLLRLAGMYYIYFEETRDVDKSQLHHMTLIS